MPCSAGAIATCEGLTSTDQTATAIPNTAPDLTGHFANMGWVGFVIMRSNKLSASNILRVTSADINLSQEITLPDVIDGRIDKTVYQMGPKIVEGTLSLPIVADVDDPDLYCIGSSCGCPEVSDLTTAGGILNNLWCWTTARGNHGRLLFDDMQLDVRYANHSAFTFDSAVVNTLSFTVTQQEAVSFDVNVIARSRIRPNDPLAEPEITDFLSPARVLTWNDFTVNGIQGCYGGQGNDLFYSNQVQEFTMEVNNNADRFYSMQGSLFPMDINVGKREVTGSLTLMGLQNRLRELAETNQDRFTEKNEIRFAFFIGEDTLPDSIVPGVRPAFDSRDWRAGIPSWPVDPIFGRRLTGVVFRIEEMSLTNELYTTTVNWLALGNDQFNYEAIADADGRPTSCAYPAWS
jgi:hypothetical protein